METLLQYTREDKPTQLWQDTFQKLLQIDSEITRIERVYQDEIHEIQQQRIINAVRNYLAEKVAQQNPDRLYKHQQVERSSWVLDSRKQWTITWSIVPLEPWSTERKEEIIRHHFSPNQAYRFYEPSNNNTPILIKEPWLSQQLTDVIVDELGFEYIHEELTWVSTEQLTKEARNYVLNKTIKTPWMMQLEKRKEELVQQYTTQHQNYTKDIIELRSQYALLSPEKKQQFLFYLMNFQNQFMREYLMPEVRKRKLLEKDYPILNLTTEEIELLKAWTHIEITDDWREVLRIPDTFNKKEERDKILRRVFQANSKMNAIDLYNALEKLIIWINNDEVKTTSTTEERIHSLLWEYRQVLRELPIEQQTEIIDAAISHYFQDALMPRETDFNKLLFMVEQNDLWKYFLKDH